MPVPPFIDRKTFLANLSQSGLLSEEQWADALPKLPRTQRGRVVARALVELGVLTRFQAERLLIGRTSGFILGQYRILEQIGKGGMGRVYKAEHRTMRRVVALKVLAPHLLDNPRAVELFLHEVQAVGQLVHPNIVTAFDANRSAGRYYLVMEYVDGPNLDKLVRRQGPLDVGLACDYVRQAAQGLQCAHNLGMVHRDVKPGNLLVQVRGHEAGSPGLVKVSDFGLARLHAGAEREGGRRPTLLTKENTVMGTPDFLSPEQARNLHKTDIRSDLYSLGCTFYYLLTGQVPFPGGTALEKLVRHGTEKPKPVTELRPEVPAPVAAVLDRLLAKDPADRYQTPAELAAALQPLAAGGSVPWATQRPGPSPLLEELRASAAEALPPDSNAPLNVASSGELSALSNTASGEGSTQDIADEAQPPRDKAGPRKPRRKWLVGVAVLLSLAAVFAGVAAAVATWFVLSLLR